jgi:hypothetical protein
MSTRPKLRYYGWGVWTCFARPIRSFSGQLTPPRRQLFREKNFQEDCVKLLPLPFFSRFFHQKFLEFAPKHEFFSQIFVNLSKFSLELLLFDKLCYIFFWNIMKLQWKYYYENLPPLPSHRSGVPEHIRASCDRDEIRWHGSLLQFSKVTFPIRLIPRKNKSCKKLIMLLMHL